MPGCSVSPTWSGGTARWTVSSAPPAPTIRSPGSVWSSPRMSAAPWIGRPLRRREDLRFLQGRARFVDDIGMPHLLHLGGVRSTGAHPVLRPLDPEAARPPPGGAGGGAAPHPA